MKSPIVVGYDASAASERALVEAAHAASLRKLPLSVVHAVDPAAPDTQVTGVEELLVDAVDLVRYRHPEVPVQTRAVVGPAATVLARASQDAAFLVVAAAMMPERALSEVCCPVVVVRDGDPERYGRVLAALDVDGTGDGILEAALAEAVVREVPLRLVQVWDDSGPDIADLEDRLRALADAGRAGHPDVTVDPEVLKGVVVDVLAEASQSSDLLFVGARRRPDGTGLDLGLGARGLLRRAVCPVAIVPVDGSSR